VTGPKALLHNPPLLSQRPATTATAVAHRKNLDP